MSGSWVRTRKLSIVMGSRVLGSRAPGSAASTTEPIPVPQAAATPSAAKVRRIWRFVDVLCIVVSLAATGAANGLKQFARGRATPGAIPRSPMGG